MTTGEHSNYISHCPADASALQGMSHEEYDRIR